MDIKKVIETQIERLEKMQDRADYDQIVSAAAEIREYLMFLCSIEPLHNDYLSQRRDEAIRSAIEKMFDPLIE